MTDVNTPTTQPAPELSGADLARIALNQAREAAKKRGASKTRGPATPPDPHRTARRARALRIRRRAPEIPPSPSSHRVGSVLSGPVRSIRARGPGCFRARHAVVLGC